ncbi:hypothetical protein T459_16946 [Capsicum annuum]|uniref:Uncharacterized protein n=1 Tax=Capsicum annuum TaxID=4072 RepID=A0A2G2ZAD2_CAPAN|nr:hypothetical protein T459_16946 [Capsicum annuum]
MTCVNHETGVVEPKKFIVLANWQREYTMEENGDRKLMVEENGEDPHWYCLSDGIPQLQPEDIEARMRVSILEVVEFFIFQSSEKEVIFKPPFEEGGSSGKVVVVHEPHKGLDLIGDSKMPNPAGRDVGSLGIPL